MPHLVRRDPSKPRTVRGESENSVDDFIADRSLSLFLAPIHVRHENLESLQCLSSWKPARAKVFDSCPNKVCAFRVVPPISIPLPTGPGNATTLAGIVRLKDDALFSFAQVPLKSSLRRCAEEYSALAPLSLDHHRASLEIDLLNAHRGDLPGATSRCIHEFDNGLIPWRGSSRDEFFDITLRNDFWQRPPVPTPSNESRRHG